MLIFVALGRNRTAGCSPRREGEDFERSNARGDSIGLYVRRLVNRTAVHIFNEQSDYKNVGKVFRAKRDETAELPTKSA